MHKRHIEDFRGTCDSPGYVTPVTYEGVHYDMATYIYYNCESHNGIISADEAFYACIPDCINDGVEGTEYNPVTNSCECPHDTYKYNNRCVFIDDTCDEFSPPPPDDPHYTYTSWFCINTPMHFSCPEDSEIELASDCKSFCYRCKRLKFEENSTCVPTSYQTTRPISSEFCSNETFTCPVGYLTYSRVRKDCSHCYACVKNTDCKYPNFVDDFVLFFVTSDACPSRDGFELYVAEATNCPSRACYYRPRAYDINESNDTNTSDANSSIDINISIDDSFLSEYLQKINSNDNTNIQLANRLGALKSDLTLFSSRNHQDLTKVNQNLNNINRVLSEKFADISSTLSDIRDNLSKKSDDNLSETLNSLITSDSILSRAISYFTNTSSISDILSQISLPPIDISASCDYTYTFSVFGSSYTLNFQILQQYTDMISIFLKITFAITAIIIVWGVL